MTGRGSGRDNPAGARRPGAHDVARSPLRDRVARASEASTRPRPDPFEAQRRVLIQQGD
jgi:hypothetical protein